MGHFFVSMGKFSGMQAKKGFAIIRPETLKRLHESVDIDRELDYSGIDEIARKNKMQMSPEVNRLIAIDLARYPSDYVNLASAKVQHSAMFRYEKSKYEAYVRRMKLTDLEFYLSRSDLEDSRYNSDGSVCTNANYAVDCLLSVFFANSEEIAHEIASGAVRIIRKRPAVFRFFSSKNSGDTICIFSTADILGVEVSPEQILFKLKGGKQCSVSTWGEGARIY